MFHCHLPTIVNTAVLSEQVCTDGNRVFMLRCNFSSLPNYNWPTLTLTSPIIAEVSLPVVSHLRFYLARQSPDGQGLLIHEVSRSHTTTHHSRWDSSGRVIISLYRPQPDNTQHSRQTDINALDGIRTYNLSRQEAADLRLRLRGNWNRLFLTYKH